MILYAATSNPGKLAEFATSASTAGSARGKEITVLALPNLATMPEPIEDASTFMGNAEKKAIAYSLLAPGLLVFADDLAFEPQSTASTDVRNNRCLLSLLAQLPNPSRSARFVCTLALARDGKVLLRAEGEVTGLLLTAPRGKDGFGYDPLFLVPRLGLTMAELPREQKWQISHRGNAFRKLLTKLQEKSF